MQINSISNATSFTAKVSNQLMTKMLTKVNTIVQLGSLDMQMEALNKLGDKSTVITDINKKTYDDGFIKVNTYFCDVKNDTLGTVAKDVFYRSENGKPDYEKIIKQAEFKMFKEKIVSDVASGKDAKKALKNLEKLYPNSKESINLVSEWLKTLSTFEQEMQYCKQSFGK